MNLKLINKVIIVGMGYLVLYTIYFIYAPSEVVISNFWRSYFYLLMFTFPFAFYFVIYPLAETVLQKLLIIVILAFLFELICYNTVLVGKEILEWNKACISKIFGFIFSGTIVLFLGIALIINKRL